MDPFATKWEENRDIMPWLLHVEQSKIDFLFEEAKVKK